MANKINKKLVAKKKCIDILTILHVLLITTFDNMLQQPKKGKLILAKRIEKRDVLNLSDIKCNGFILSKLFY